MCHHGDRRSGLEGDGWNSIKSRLKNFVFKSLPLNQACNWILPSSLAWLASFCCCCYRSINQSFPTLCDHVDCNIPGLSVPHHLPKFAQVHVHCFGDAIQLSNPLMPSSPSALNFCQHQGLFQWVDQIAGTSASASVLPMSFQCWFPLRLTDLISLQSKRLSGFFSSNTVWRH